MLDTGAHFYDTYETKDGKYVSIGSIEPQFYASSCSSSTGLDGEDAAAPVRPRALAGDEGAPRRDLPTKTRDEWCAIMEGTDVCFAPVLTMGEAPQHPHNEARSTFVEVGGVRAAGARRRASAARRAEIERPPATRRAHRRGAPRLGLRPDEIAELRGAGAIA